MEADREGTEPSREVRLEGAALILAGGIGLAALAAGRGRTQRR